MSALESRLQTAEANVVNLLQKYEKENLDVQQIQGETFSAFVYKLFGKFEGKLQKEQQQQIEAKSNYDKAVADLEEIKQEKQQLASRLSALYQQAKEYEAELESRRISIQQLSRSATQLYNQFEDEMDFFSAQITEIDEALRAASRVTDTAESAMDSLDSAEGWATYDIWAKSGILTHAIKYSHIDDAEDCFNRLSSLIQSLRSELVDVQGLSASDLTQISPTQRSIDFWFDNIFTDLSVRSQIQDNMEQLRHLMGGINTVETLLNGKRQNLISQFAEKKQLQEDLLVSL